MDKKRKAGRLLLVGNVVSAACAVLVLGAVFVWAPPCQGLLELANYTDKTFGGYITGKIIDSLIIGVLCYIACLIFDMPYALLLSTFIAITNIIPVVGPFIGAIPGVFIIFIIDPRKAFWFIVINIVLQQLDGNIIGPMILGNRTGVSGFWVITSIVVFGGFFGIIGIIIAVPATAVPGPARRKTMRPG